MNLLNKLDEQFNQKYVLRVLNTITHKYSYLFESNPLSYDSIVKEKERLSKQHENWVVTIINYNKYAIEND